MNVATSNVTMQIVIDSVDSHTLADFYAGGLGYEVEDVEEIIDQMLTEGYATAADVSAHDGKRVWAEGSAARHPTLPRIFFQQVPETKQGKNRVHFDVHVGSEDRDGLVEHLIENGATKLYEGQQGPHSWVTLADPEGNEFCVS